MPIDLQYPPVQSAPMPEAGRFNLGGFLSRLIGGIKQGYYDPSGVGSYLFDKNSRRLEDAATARQLAESQAGTAIANSQTRAQFGQVPGEQDAAQSTALRKRLIDQGYVPGAQGVGVAQSRADVLRPGLENELTRANIGHVGAETRFLGGPQTANVDMDTLVKGNMMPFNQAEAVARAAASNAEAAKTKALTPGMVTAQGQENFKNEPHVFIGPDGQARYSTWGDFDRLTSAEQLAYSSALAKNLGSEYTAFTNQGLTQDVLADRFPNLARAGMANPAGPESKAVLDATSRILGHDRTNQGAGASAPVAGGPGTTPPRQGTTGGGLSSLITGERGHTGLVNLPSWADKRFNDYSDFVSSYGISPGPRSLAESFGLIGNTERPAPSVSDAFRQSVYGPSMNVLKAWGAGRLIGGAGSLLKSAGSGLRALITRSPKPGVPTPGFGMTPPSAPGATTPATSSVVPGGMPTPTGITAGGATVPQAAAASWETGVGNTLAKAASSGKQAVTGAGKGIADAWRSLPTGIKAVAGGGAVGLGAASLMTRPPSAPTPLVEGVAQSLSTVPNMDQWTLSFLLDVVEVKGLWPQASQLIDNPQLLIETILNAQP